MPTTRLILPTAFLSALTAFGVCPVRAADGVEGVKEKLFQAKKEYDAEVRTFRTSVGDWLDKPRGRRAQSGQQEAGRPS